MLTSKLNSFRKKYNLTYVNITYPSSTKNQQFFRCALSINKR